MEINRKILAIICLSIGFFVGAVTIDANHWNHGCDERKDFNKLSQDCQYSKITARSIQKINNLEYSVESFVNNEKAKDPSLEVAIYFRDLKYKAGFGIDERKDFIPASLLKLPFVMSVYEMEENNQKILDEKVVYTGIEESQQFSQNYKPVESLEIGKEYTIRELCHRILSYSDNQAYFFLYNYFTEKIGNDDFVIKAYRDLGIIDPGDDISKSAVNAKGYGSIFRQLYHSAYLEENDSEEILDFLSESKFIDGIRKSVPSDITISHKFGERSLSDTEKQLHDCGIVYKPHHPYILCVMTKGG